MIFGFLHHGVQLLHSTRTMESRTWMVDENHKNGHHKNALWHQVSFVGIHGIELVWQCMFLGIRIYTCMDDVYTFLDWASIFECGAPEKVLKLKRWSHFKLWREGKNCFFALPIPFPSDLIGLSSVRVKLQLASIPKVVSIGSYNKVVMSNNKLKQLSIWNWNGIDNVSNCQNFLEDIVILISCLYIYLVEIICHYQFQLRCPDHHPMLE